MVQKISSKDWTKIGKFNYAASWCKCLCSYCLIYKDDNTLVREQSINWLAYSLIFIPVHLLQVFVCLWDGGLKEFVILDRKLGSDTLTKGSMAYEQAINILNEHRAKKTVRRYFSKLRVNKC